jgi:hypothetical protein
MDHSKVGHKSMSLKEKMSMWAGNSYRHSPGVPTDFFIKIQDEMDEGIDEAKLSVYAQTILSSPAYRWFISSLQKEAQLDWRGCQLRIMITRIRDRILRELPVGTISSKEPPHSYQMTFKLPWERTDSKLTAYSRGTIDSMVGDREVLTLTSSDQAQVTTVRDYIQQTWTSNDILNVLIDSPKSDEVLNEQGRQDSGPKQSISASWLTPGHLHVTVSGSAYYISRIGEQLAWLVTALKPHIRPQIWLPCWVPDLIIENSRNITIRCSSEIPNLQEIWPVGFRFLSAAVYGYPTLRRPEGFPGVELPIKVLRRCIGEGEVWIRSHDGCSVLSGHLTALKLVKRTDAVFLWHRLSSDNETCSCRCADTPRLTRGRENYPLSLCMLEDYRHVIGMCKTFSREARICDTSRTVSLRSTSTSSTSSVAQSPVHSLDSSLDSALLSISDSSQSPECSPLNPTSIWYPVINQTARCIFLQARASIINTAVNSCTSRQAEQQVDQNDSPNQDQAQSISSQSQQGLISSCNGRSEPQERMNKKRRRDKGEPGDDEDDEDGEAKAKVARRQSHSLKSLACPFWKRYPGRYQCCLPKRLTKISYVKQHLIRYHTPDFYCQRCFVIFSNEDCLSNHIGGFCNSTNRPPRLDGVTTQQSRILHRKSKAGSTESEQWYVIWEILFKDDPTPDSPYVDLELSEDLVRYREVLENRGLTAFQEQLEQSGIPLPSADERDALIRGIWTQIVGLVEQDWRASRTSRHTPSTNISNLHLNQSSSNVGETSSTSLLESAVALPQERRTSLEDIRGGRYDTSSSGTVPSIPEYPLNPQYTEPGDYSFKDCDLDFIFNYDI